MLPIISITPYLSPPSDANARDRRATANALHTACRDVGFFYLDISAFASSHETQEIEQLARQFFMLPQAQKDEISISKQDHARGYQRLNENVTQGKPDSHEAIDLYAPTPFANPDPTRPLGGTNQWPTVPSFRETYEKWVVRMKELGLIVMEAMADGLGMSSEEWASLRSQVDDSFWVLRIIGYPPLAKDHDGFSCGAHKDYGCLTFLYADPTPGALQVFRPSSSGGTWINADPIPNAIVVNIGEMWEIWTNGLYKSTLHRVIHQGANYRVSIPFFFEPNFDAQIAPLPSARRLIARGERNPAADGNEPKEYAPVVYGTFLLGKVSTNFAGGKGKYD